MAHDVLNLTRQIARIMPQNNKPIEQANRIPLAGPSLFPGAVIDCVTERIPGHYPRH
jgi:hypothetical protein